MNNFFLRFFILWQCLILTSCTSKPSGTIINYKAFVINLDRAQDRMKAIEDQFKTHNIKFERFNAVDGYKILITDLEKNITYTGLDLKNKLFEFSKMKKYYIDCGREEEANFIFYKLGDYTFTSGELGCTCSHRSIIIKAIQEKLDRIVIFEDDVQILSDDFSFLMNSALIQMPKNSVVFLDAHGNGLEKYKIDLSHRGLLIPLHNIYEFYGCYAIILDISFAKNLLKKGNIETWPFDNKIANLVTSKVGLGFILNRKIATFREELGSEIKEMGRAF